MQECLELQQNGSKFRIGELLQEKGYISEENLMEALSIQIVIPYVRRISGGMVYKKLV